MDNLSCSKGILPVATQAQRLRKSRTEGLTDSRFYDATRHTGGSWITMTSGGLAATKRILRHKNPKTTMCYSHWVEPQLRQAVPRLDKVLGSPEAAQIAATPQAA